MPPRIRERSSRDRTTALGFLAALTQLLLLLAAVASADSGELAFGENEAAEFLDFGESEAAEPNFGESEAAEQHFDQSEEAAAELEQVTEKSEKKWQKSKEELELKKFYPNRDRLERFTYLPIDGDLRGDPIPDDVKTDIQRLLRNHSADEFLQEALKRVDAEDADSGAHGVADVYASKCGSSRYHHGHMRSNGAYRQLDRYARIWQYTSERWLHVAGKHRNRTFKEALLRVLNAFYRQRGNSTSASTCPPSSGAPPACSSCAPYRTADGTCNNLGNPRYGMAGAPLQRLALSVYEDGVGAPRVTGVLGSPLPSARKVSTTVIGRDSKLSSEITHMVMQWGQFLDHDFTASPMIAGDDGIGLTCCVDDVQAAMGLSGEQVAAKQRELEARYGCFSIPVPKDDPVYRNRKCLGFSRSSTVPHLDCKLGQRSPVNKLTSGVDGSMVYGSSQTEQNDLRSFTSGLLKTLELPGRPRSLPPQKSGQNECNKRDAANECFTAGDDRVNEQPGLLSMHTLLVREHNRVATILKRLNRRWNDERLFQEARKIVVAEIQHITYKDFVPIILGPGLYDAYKLQPLADDRYYRGYNAKVDLTVRTEFSSVAYRFGHTLIRDSFSHCDKSFRSIGSFELKNNFFSPDIAYNSSFGISTVLRGLLTDPAESFDHRITTQVVDHLFETGGKVNTPLDLISLNIQRARDHGIPSYVSLREVLGMSVPRSFDGLRDTHNADDIERFKAVYDRVEDIDAFPAGVSERSLPGAVLGPLFGKIVAIQYALAKTGDRFYYENDCKSAFGSCGRCLFTLDQLKEIKKASLSRLLCDNADIPYIRSDAFKIQSRVGLCATLPSPKFDLWKESGDE